MVFDRDEGMGKGKAEQKARNAREGHMYTYIRLIIFIRAIYLVNSDTSSNLDGTEAFIGVGCISLYKRSQIHSDDSPRLSKKSARDLNPSTRNLWLKEEEEEG